MERCALNLNFTRRGVEQYKEKRFGYEKIYFIASHFYDGFIMRM